MMKFNIASYRNMWFGSKLSYVPKLGNG